MLITKYSRIFYIIILSFFSFYINYYYGHLGVYPLDTFLFYDSSVRILNGEIPFKDFWVSTGVTIDLIHTLMILLLLELISILCCLIFVNVLLCYKNFLCYHTVPCVCFRSRFLLFMLIFISISE